MSYVDRPLDNPINWSLRVGRLFAIDIRVHVIFIICALSMLAMELPRPGSAEPVIWSEALLFASGSYLILFALVLLHEFGHCFGARWTGGEADEILIWPLGGLASTNPPHTPRAHFLTTAAGPAVNVVVCALCAALLLAWTGSFGSVPWNPLHPTIPVDPKFILTATRGQEWVMRVYGLSYILLLFNLLPIFPLDGGRLLQAWLWKRSDFTQSMMIATGTGMVGAILLGLFGLFIEESWMLLCIATFGYITCWQLRRATRDHAEFAGAGFDFPAGGESSWEGRSERPKRVGWWKRYRARRALACAEKERQRLADRQHAVEEILKKVSREGLRALSARERRILEEETERQRSLSGKFDDSTLD